MNPLSAILRKVPFLKYTTAFCLGILIGLKTDHWSPWLLLFSTILILAVFFFQKIVVKRSLKNSIQVFLMVATLLALGMVYSSKYTRNLSDKNFNKNALYTAYVFDKVPSHNHRYRYLVHLTSVKDSGILRPAKEKVLLYVSDSTTNNNLQLGSQIVFQAKFYPIQSANNPGEFNYKKFMLLKGIRYQAYLQKDVVTFAGKKRTPRIIALQIQAKLQKKYLQAGIKGDEFAVLTALTLGNKSYLTSDLKSRFADSGAMHVLSVSGLHVGIIYLILLFLFKPIANNKNWRPVKVIIIILLLWAYAFITGLSPSVLRSATMFSLILIGENLNRKTNIYNTLAFSAFLLMIINPTIIYRAGFQLSYAAVTSIVFFQPKIASLLKTEHQILKRIWDLFAVSLAAQIGTFPLSIFYFHQFPLYFWLSNFIAIPAATILLYLAFFFFLTSPVLFLSKAIAVFLNLTVKGLNRTTLFIENLPGSVIHNIWMDQTLMILLIVFIILGAWAIVNKRSQLIIANLTLLLLIVGYTTFFSLEKYRQATIVFYNSYSQPLLSIIDRNQQFYYSPLDSLNHYSQQLINNSANYFGTKDTAKNIRHLNKRSDIRFYKDKIFFKHLTIICNNKEQKLTTAQGSILWHPSTGNIFTHKSSNLRFYTLKKDETINITTTQSIVQYKTQDNSSLLIKIH